MVKYRIETFKHTLLSEVHLIDEEPTALLDGLEKHTIAPMETDVILMIFIVLSLG